ncbi:MAG TPA: hypothetical protein DCY55_13665 [Gammaproteobacteria bacterium]|jgi:hypothetical protein|nr:hypothetical protein [Gammaproteobacteria bacterium]
MKILFSSLLAISMLIGSSVQAQVPLLPDGETMLLTVFLKHDQTMNNSQRGELLEKTGFNDTFPPEGVEIVDHYVMMGIGQVIVLRMPPDHLRRVNVAIELGAWGAYQTEFYITYDLAEARRAAAAQ